MTKLTTREAPSWEHQYLSVLRDITNRGTWKKTRQKDKLTGEFLETRGIPGATIVVAPHEYPLITLRPMRRGLAMFLGELWDFLAGDNTIEGLHRYGVPYWDDWVTPEMIERAGLPAGNLGRIYGPQWRGYYGIEGTPFDQIEAIMWKLRNEPWDKRMIAFAYHPADSHRPKAGGGWESTMPVRTCHGNFHLLWDGDQTVDMVCLQVSADMPLGVPSNLCMYKTLLTMFCQLTGMKPGTLTYNLSDTHYYSNQVEGVAMLLDREPFPSPTISYSDSFMEGARLIMDDKEQWPLERASLNPYRMAWIEWMMRAVTVEGYETHKVIPRKLLPVAV